MRKGFYRKLAWTGIRKNKRLYIPYMLTCMGMVMMCYIVSFLGSSPTFANIPGGTTMQGFLGLGFGVLCVFALIFLFYTNSFLIRRRKKEFGLYNILGMGKRNLALVLCWETLIIAGITLFSGLFFGILFSKFVELGMVKILGGTASFTFSVGFSSLYQTVIVFLVIFALILLNALRQIHMTNPIELLHSENAGEKPPKANWLVAVLGAVILAAAYYLAVSIEDPISAMIWFFVAVVMVIVASYLLFIAGSVALCRLLQKKKSYYYKTNHFVSISSMVYRMKRNGAGLASICILCTMVLVMVSSTVCLYIGAEDSLRTRYPRNINLNATVSSLEMLNSDYKEQVKALAEEVSREHGAAPENTLDYRYADFGGYLQGNTLMLELPDSVNHLSEVTNMWQVFVVPLEDYNRLMGTEETLVPGEAMVFTTKEQQYTQPTIAFGDGAPLTVKKQAESFVDNGVDAMQIIPTMYLFVPNFDEIVRPLMETENGTGNVVNLRWSYGFDLSCDDDTQIQIHEQLSSSLSQMEDGIGEGKFFHVLLEGVAKERAGFYGLYGGLFFLGILLGIVFIFAAVLIIYYKQVSEGYEDQARFAIMQKVGMTKKEIRRSINSQILTVFFLPLITAGVHLAFAFPLIRKLLLLFNLTNGQLLLLVTAGCYLIFALFYVLVYRVTSRSYFSIVSGMRREDE